MEFDFDGRHSMNRRISVSGVRLPGYVSGACRRRRIGIHFAGTCANLLLALFLTGGMAARAEPGVTRTPCPDEAIAVEPGASIQAAVDAAGRGATFCLKNGVHRSQVIRPKDAQRFFGEGETVLNGSRLLTQFDREGRYWVAIRQFQRGRKHGECVKEAPACALPEGFFIDDQPLVQVLNKEDLATGRFYFDHAGGRIYFADDPIGRKVEATVAVFAFRSTASNVLIKNLTIEKYASIAQEGAIQAQDVAGWIVESCELRLNSAAGIAVGSGARVRASKIHHNGQIGITGVGRDVVIEGTQVWANNTRGFLPAWEAGGVKLAASDDVVFRGNHVHHNLGAGLWCDINCRGILYERNLVEDNNAAGIFHEISFSAVIRDNVVRHNGIASKGWFWGNDILVAASQDVEVYGNELTVSPDKCGLMLVDQSRPLEGDARKSAAPTARYKTRNNRVHDNELTFEGAVCAGGASDAGRGDENYAVITDGNNIFDRNLYRAPKASGPHRFAWGHAVFDWDAWRRLGVEPNGRFVFY